MSQYWHIPSYTPYKNERVQILSQCWEGNKFADSDLQVFQKTKTVLDPE
jgi:hypothetical protein